MIYSYCYSKVTRKNLFFFPQLPVRMTPASMVNVSKPSTATSVHVSKAFMEIGVSTVRNAMKLYLFTSL